MIRIAATPTLLCSLGAPKLVGDLMLISTDGYRATFYRPRLNASLKPSSID